MNIIVHFTEDKRKDEELINKVFEKAFIKYIESQGKEKQKDMLFIQENRNSQAKAKVLKIKLNYAKNTQS